MIRLHLLLKEPKYRLGLHVSDNLFFSPHNDRPPNLNFSVQCSWWHDVKCFCSISTFKGVGCVGVIEIFTFKSILLMGHQWLVCSASSCALYSLPFILWFIRYYVIMRLIRCFSSNEIYRSQGTPPSLPAQMDGKWRRGKRRQCRVPRRSSNSGDRRCLYVLVATGEIWKVDNTKRRRLKISFFFSKFGLLMHVM